MGTRQTGQSWPAGTFLSSLSSQDCQELLALGTTVDYAPNTVLLAEGTHDSQVVLIRSGIVKVYGVTAAGHSTLLAIRTAGDLIGELAAVDGEPRSSSILSATKVRVRRVDAPLFREFLHRHAAAADALQRAIAAKLRAATQFRVEVGSAPVRARLARILAHLASRYGRPDPDGAGQRIAVPLSQADLASLAAAGLPSVVRELAELRQRDLIRTGYRTIVVVDQARLQAYAESAASQ
jgi:CRP-like cAMP-binding protein